MHNLSKSRVAFQFVTTPCQCVTCGFNMQVVLETNVLEILGEVHIKYPKQGAFNCINCNSTYVKWGGIKITQ